ncbi:metal-dependent transcriptional regulator [bacterium]|nr:metal-dependent transcriptional regulator [bacterium]MBU1984298.1 metal-dependent transcriptional regulator [bacterium]
MQLSVSAEDSLLALYRMAERGEAPTTSGLARDLGVADSTVTAMIQRLARKKLLNYRARREISLSDTGQNVAARLIRRHRLLETYLWVHLGYSLGEVHAEAEQLEHAVSDTFVDRLSRILGCPNVDPHGDPIPDTDGKHATRLLRPLSDARPGQTNKLAQVLISSPEVLSYLEGIGLHIGQRVEVVDAVPQAGVLHVRLGGAQHALDRETARQLLIETTEPIS